MPSTSCDGSGLKTMIRFGKGKARSGREESSALGLPPGQPVIVCWISLKTLMLS